jgi:hypothetical protein
MAWTRHGGRHFLKADSLPLWSLINKASMCVVKKPGSGYRICIDYRKLNAVTVKDRYPPILP